MSLRDEFAPLPLFDGQGFRRLRTAIALSVTLITGGMLAATYAILRPADAPPVSLPLPLRSTMR
jgi:hypothetical protein